LTDAPADGVTHWDGPGLDAWHAFTPAELAARLDGVDVPWCVVGGWSIDLSLGRITRHHEDLEIEILRADFPVVRAALAPLAGHAVGSGQVRRLADGEVPPPPLHQSWFLDTEADEWRVDVMLAGGDADTWVSRRAAVSAPRDEMVGRTAGGIPHLLPHGALLYKAKAPRPKDEADLEVALPTLSGAQRAWLRDALERAHPGHAWLARLA
jgi:hypothetical protein